MTIFIQASGLYERHNKSSWRLDGIFKFKIENHPEPCKLIFIPIRIKFGWIKEIVESEISSSEFEIHCNFVFHHDIDLDYTCAVDILLETFNESLFTSAVGKHQKFYGDHKVSKIKIEKCQSVYFPSGVGFLFENLRKFIIRSGNVEFLSRNNFKTLTKLIDLVILDNPIVTIPEDAFADLTNLVGFAICYSKLEAFQKNLFAKLKNLDHLYAPSNLITHIDTRLFRNNLELRIIDLKDNKIFKIDGKFSLLPNLKQVWLKDNVCIDLNWNVEKNLQSVSIQKFDELIEINCMTKFENIETPSQVILNKS